MISLRLGNTSDDFRVLNKNITLSHTVNCRIKGDCDIENPTFILNASNAYLNCNYAYVPAWDKYYFISSPPTVSEGGTMEIRCTEDVLMSWKYTILDSGQFIARNEYDFNASIPDGMLPTTTKTQTIVKSFGNDVKSELSVKFMIGVI